MTEPTAYESAAFRVWDDDVAPAFANPLMQMCERQRAAVEGSEEQRAISTMIEIWESTYKHCLDRVGEEFPAIADHWKTLAEIRERFGPDDN